MNDAAAGAKLVDLTGETKLQELAAETNRRWRAVRGYAVLSGLCFLAFAASLLMLWQVAEERTEATLAQMAAQQAAMRAELDAAPSGQGGASVAATALPAPLELVPPPPAPPTPVAGPLPQMAASAAVDLVSAARQREAEALRKLRAAQQSRQRAAEARRRAEPQGTAQRQAAERALRRARTAEEAARREAREASRRVEQLVAARQQQEAPPVAERPLIAPPEAERSLIAPLSEAGRPQLAAAQGVERLQLPAAHRRAETQPHEGKEKDGWTAILTSVVAALGFMTTGTFGLLNLRLARRAESRQVQELHFKLQAEERQAREFQLKLRQLEHQVRELDAKEAGEGSPA